MDLINVKAYAKINLSLDVLERRDDGYHELSTIMHSVPLVDDITIGLGGGGFSCKTNLDFIANDTNLAVRAARRFVEHSGIDNPGLHINIYKRIPVGAGMGGGSADAAAVLTALNRHFGEPIAPNDMLVIAAALGADVPFCMAGGTAHCTGIGEIIAPLVSLPPCTIVVVKPQASLSTSDMFARLDAFRAAGKRRERPDTAGIINALEEGDLPAVLRRLYNVMEPVATERCGDIGRVRNEMVRLGAGGACMTGSGSAVYGIFDRIDVAENAYDRLSDEFKETFLLIN